MNIFYFLLGKGKTSICILAGFLSLSLFVIYNSNENIKEYNGNSFVVRINHYGLNAGEIEKSITIPLEDALSSLSGISNVQSSSENNLSRVFIQFKTGGKGYYEAVSDAVQRVYETLPSSVQRPEIISSNNSNIPVWSAAVYSSDINGLNENNIISELLEKTVKPRLEKLEGTGEVIISGIGKKEIHIIFDQEKLVMLGIEPSSLAGFLAMNDSVFPGGTILHNNTELVITVDGRYTESLGDAIIPLKNENSIRLSEIALITEQERMPDILSRLNGKKTAGLAIMEKNGADLRKLSAEINNELSALHLPLEFTVLTDLGAEERNAFRSVTNAALFGALIVIIICFILNGKDSLNFSGFLCALTIPLICLISIAILSMAGFSINRYMFAGIAAGTGTAVDAVVLCTEKLRRAGNIKSAQAALSELICPLTAGTATTVAAILPLLSFENTEIRTTAYAIAVICISALLISLLFLPSLLIIEKRSKKIKSFNISFNFHKKISLRISRLSNRLLAVNAKLCFRYHYIFILAGIIISVIGISALVSKGLDITEYGSGDSLYAQAEFESGLLSEEVDRLLAIFANKLLETEGIRNVETGARTGSGSLLISFDPELLKAHDVRKIAKEIYIPGGFVFFHESSNRERHFEIRIYGDEEKKCRELAAELAYLCAGHPLINDRVFNFKQGSKKITLLPYREFFTESGISFYNAASGVRLGVFGPVAYKRKLPDREIDIRINTTSDINNIGRHKTIEEVFSILIPSDNNPGSSLRTDSLFSFNEEIESSSIRRANRRRTASITIITKPMDPRRLKNELNSVFEKLDLPPGYSVEFDPNAIKQAEALSSTVLSFIMAVIFCYMIIASINESYSIPFIILSVIPPSLSVPAIVLLLSGKSYSSAIACAFIAVSGMTVNSAVLCVNGLLSRIKKGKQLSIMGIYLALRKKIPALAATSATTACGAIPFLFLKESANELIKTISIVGALGVACSSLFSITIIPSILILTKKTGEKI